MTTASHTSTHGTSAASEARIDTLEVMDSTLGRRQLRFVLAWAELDQEELAENWRRAFVDSETGTVVWPGGADLAPDTLYLRVKTGAWPGSEIAA